MRRAHSALGGHQGEQGRTWGPRFIGWSTSLFGVRSLACTWCVTYLIICRIPSNQQHTHASENVSLKTFPSPVFLEEKNIHFAKEGTLRKCLANFYAQNLRVDLRRGCRCKDAETLMVDVPLCHCVHMRHTYVCLTWSHIKSRFISLISWFDVFFCMTDCIRDEILTIIPLWDFFRLFCAAGSCQTQKLE